MEFKASFGKEVIETLCAFANNKGGTVLIGVKDNGKVTGIATGPETIQSWVNQIKQGSMLSIIPNTELPPQSPPVERVLLICKKATARDEIQKQLELKDKKHFLATYLRPALASGLLAMTIPDKPNSPLQKYRLTESGKQWIAER